MCTPFWCRYRSRRHATRGIIATGRPAAPYTADISVVEAGAEWVACPRECVVDVSAESSGLRAVADADAEAFWGYRGLRGLQVGRGLDKVMGLRWSTSELHFDSVEGVLNYVVSVEIKIVVNMSR